MDRQTFANFDLLSFYMAILVVSIHLSIASFYDFDFSSTADRVCFFCFNVVKDTISLVCVPFFFLKSGILFFRNFKLGDYFPKIKRRFFSLFIPYCIWNMLCYLFDLFVCNFPLTSKYIVGRSVSFGFEDFLRAVLLYENNLVNWFLLTLIFFALFSPVFLALAKNKYIGLAFVLLAFYGFENICESSAWIPPYVSSAFGFYLLGALIARYGMGFFSLRFDAVWGRAAWVTLVLLYALLFAYKSELNTLVYYPIIFACLVCIWVGVSSLNVESRWFYGASFIIYESQVIVAASAMKLIYILFPHTSYFAVANFYATLAISTVLSVALYAAIKKYPLLRALLNGR